MPTAEVNGIELHYDVTGEGRPLLLISGLGQNSLVWGPIIPMLSDRYRVVTFDNRGTGRSSVPDGPYTIDEMADDAAELIHQLDLGPTKVLGWSLGGSVTQSLLINHGDLLERAVILSGFPSYTRVQDAWLDVNLLARREGLDAATLGASGMAWGFTVRTLADHNRAFEQSSLALQDPYPTTYEGFAGQAAGLRTYDSRTQLASVKTPTLVLVGAEDTLTPVSQSVEMAKLLRNGRLEVLPRGSHGMILEYPDDVVAAIKAFLEERLD